MPRLFSERDPNRYQSVDGFEFGVYIPFFCLYVLSVDFPEQRGHQTEAYHAFGGLRLGGGCLGTYKDILGYMGICTESRTTISNKTLS